VTWATSVPILVFLGLPVLDLGPMYATDRRQTSDRQTSDAHHHLMPYPRDGGIITVRLITSAKKATICLFVSKIMQKLLKLFSQNSVERRHMDHGRSD